MYVAFHGQYNEHVMEIRPAQPDDAAEIRADHRTQIREEIRQTSNRQSPPFFFALIFNNNTQQNQLSFY